jgi:hypothetical protein
MYHRAIDPKRPAIGFFIAQSSWTGRRVLLTFDKDHTMIIDGNQDTHRLV